MQNTIAAIAKHAGLVVGSLQDVAAIAITPYHLRPDAVHPLPIAQIHSHAADARLASVLLAAKQADRVIPAGGVKPDIAAAGVGLIKG